MARHLISGSIVDPENPLSVALDESLFSTEAGLTALSLMVPAANAAAIAPSDTVDLPNPTRAIYVGVTGNIVVDLVTSGTTILFTAVPVGILPVQAKRVRNTSTTATGLVALW